MNQEIQNANLAIQSASAGLALQGIFCCDQYEQVMSSRYNLIKVKDSIVRVQPHDGGLDIEEEFTLEHNEKTFIKLVEIYGYKHTIGVDANLSFGGNLDASILQEGINITQIITALFLPKINIGGGFSRTSETNNKSEISNSSETKSNYYSKVHLAIVPVDACTLKESNIQLDDDALDELKKIDRLLSTRDANNPEISQVCQNFFHQYGSHALLGRITLGGIYVLSSYTQDFSSIDTNTIKRIVSDKLDEKIKLWMGIDPTSGSSPKTGKQAENSEPKQAENSEPKQAQNSEPKQAQNSNSQKPQGNQANIHGSREKWSENQSENSTTVERIASTVRVETRTIGGNSLEGDNVQAWKNTLRDGQNLAIINREMKPIAVWKIIGYHHATEFENSFQLVKRLYQEWIQVSGCYEPFEDRDAIHIFRDALRYQISSWIEKRDFTTRPLKTLEKMREQIESVNSQGKYWAQEFLSEPKLQEYLQQYLGENKEPDRESKNWIKRLLTPQDAGDLKEKAYEKLKDVFTWVKDKPILSIDEPLNTLKELRDRAPKIVERLTLGQSNPEKEEEDLEQKIISLRSSLREQNPLSELYLLVLLFPFAYDPVKNIFKKSLEPEDYHKLENLIEEESTNLFDIKRTGVSVEKREAHLLLKLIENIEFGEEDRADFFIKETIKPNIESKLVNRIIKKSNFQSLSERQEATQELKEIIQHKPQSKQKPKGVGLDDVLRKKQPMENPQPKTHSEPSPDLKEMLNHLGLSQYYPEKLDRQEIYQVTEASMKEDTLTEPEQLTQHFIGKLLLFNYEARQLKMIVEEDPHKDNGEILEDWL
ncbi:MAC/perforin domain-containing protein [Roseofilum reptotaenium CS-1145]|uniref:MACPF domain-containing protein n=1 Tax=Roseofilum reptotaenium AO1-A TaxID=1925591 RepID=A0A1L9QRI5_9CYAN|nr:MAC/perforin domain-containing protein [Roseofilum reptotaenium]MDB9519886.1 MAC/perforin domain-containing protein [Roseofilum reptotaenium CS-1145]OJJ25197.1 hypothetical protein BI308_12675 [Roseofilum reptotaenium AO1-A]